MRNKLITSGRDAAAMAKSRFLQEALERGWTMRQLDALVVSFGGAGTTMLLRWLGKQLRVNHFNSFEDGLKHVGSPSHPALARVRVDRVVYLVSDPRETVLSLFRRGYHETMPAKLASTHRTAKQYGAYVARNRSEASLESFLEGATDSFGFEAHWDAWIRDSPPRPTMIIRYEHIPEAVPALLEFLGLPPSMVTDFPKWTERESSLASLSGHDRERLDLIYGGLAERIASRPPWEIRGL